MDTSKLSITHKSSIHQRRKTVAELEGKSTGMLDIPDKKFSPTKKRNASSSIGFNYKEPKRKSARKSSKTLKKSVS